MSTRRTQDDATPLWVRHASDEAAVRAGHRFSVFRGAYAVWWIERYCRLYEGDYAGQPMRLRGLHDEPLDRWTIHDVWDDQARRDALARAQQYARAVREGAPHDWQYECVMRLFGWICWSDDHQAWVRRFRRGSIWVPKKNKKSPTLAAIALYLTCGDGEMGQKVFIGAKDGAQARENVGRHILEMVSASPELSHDCTINRSLMQVLHEPTRSVVRPISSGDERTRLSKEGLNGSVLIDETHVVDQEFITRVSRAGISRREPIHLEVSTAGLDKDCYGYRQWEYGQQVASGQHPDLRYFFAAWAAPQDLRDEDLAADPLRYARQANPAWGHTVFAEEWLDDYQRSTRSVYDLQEFRTYRLNIWRPAVTEAWIRSGDWAACGQSYSLADLSGRTCYGGLDLSLRWDTTALVLLFPEADSERYRLWPIIFVTEVSVAQTRSVIPWEDWARQGFVQITPGNTTDFALVRQTLRTIQASHDLVCVGYDDRFAETLAQELQDEDGIAMLNVPQTPAQFLEPTALVEKDIRDGRLVHPRNACLDWQISHAVRNPRGMLQKPDGHHGIKKIDAVTALVMARQVLAAKQAEGAAPRGGALLIC